MSIKTYFKSGIEFDEQRDKVWKHICKYLQNYISPLNSILDLGAGHCNFINNIEGNNKYAVDLFNDLKKYASCDVKCYISKCFKLNFIKSHSIDVVFSSNLFEHLEDDEIDKTLKDILRILKDNGKLILMQPNFRYCYKNYFDDYTHIKVFTDESLQRLLKLYGFNITKCMPKFLPYSIKNKASKLSCLIPLYLKSPIKPFAGQMLLIGEKITWK